MVLLRQGPWFYEVQLLTCGSFKAQSSLALLCCLFLCYIVLKQSVCNNACMPKLRFAVLCSVIQSAAIPTYTCQNWVLATRDDVRFSKEPYHRFCRTRPAFPWSRITNHVLFKLFEVISLIWQRHKISPTWLKRIGKATRSSLQVFKVPVTDFLEWCRIFFYGRPTTIVDTLGRPWHSENISGFFWK